MIKECLLFSRMANEAIPSKVYDRFGLLSTQMIIAPIPKNANLTCLMHVVLDAYSIIAYDTSFIYKVAIPAVIIARDEEGLWMITVKHADERDCLREGALIKAPI